MNAVDVLAVLDFHIANMTAPRQQPQVDELREVRAAMLELIDAAEYALATRDEAGGLNDTADYNLTAAIAACKGSQP